MLESIYSGDNISEVVAIADRGEFDKLTFEVSSITFKGDFTHTRDILLDIYQVRFPTMECRHEEGYTYVYHDNFPTNSKLTWIAALEIDKERMYDIYLLLTIFTHFVENCEGLWFDIYKEEVCVAV